MKVNFNRIIMPSSKEDILNLLTKIIQCKICLNLLNDPYDCLCCNQTFCKSCIINYIKTNNKCPFSEFFETKKDRKNNKNINELMKNIKPSSSNFNKVIQSLKFYCLNKEKGCDSELNIEEILEHEKLCKFSINDCGQSLKKKKSGSKENEIKNKNNKIKNKINETNENKSRNYIGKSQKDIAIKKSGKNEELNIKRKNIINLTFRNSLNYNNSNNNSNNNQLKQQDSLVSFYNSKNNIDEIQMNTINSLGNQDNEINDKKEILNLEKFEKSIDEINQKLSIINKVIINNLDFKTNNEKYLKLNSNNNFYKNSEKEVSEFNISENDKTHKNNSMAITNNYYDGSYINTINNFSNNSMEKLNYLDIIKNDKSKTNNKKFLSLNTKSTIETSKKNNRYEKYLKIKKNTISNMNSKNKINKEFKSKNLNLLTEADNKENLKILRETKEENLTVKTSLNFTPKLGTKSQKKIFDNKNFNNSGEFNNNIYPQSETRSSLEEPLILLKNLENKMNFIEKILQSNNCLISQEYSIQNGENSKKNEKENINNSVENKYNEEKILNLVKEMINQKENDFKKILNDQIESIKKYLSDKCIEEMRKTVLDTNFDIMSLYRDKLEEFEKIVNKYYKDNQESK